MSSSASMSTPPVLPSTDSLESYRPRRSWTKRDYFTYLILFVLLYVRFPFTGFWLFLGRFLNLSIFPVNPESLRLFDHQTVIFGYGYSFILVALVILINHDRVHELNIDKGFIPVFLFGGWAFLWSPYRSNGYDHGSALAFPIVLLAFWVFMFGVSGRLKFGGTWPVSMRIMLGILAGFGLAVLPISKSIDLAKVYWAGELFLAQIHLLIVEEAMFRGLLWMFLKRLKFSGFWIIIFQAILFWVAHIDRADNQLFFWAQLPLGSILLGGIVWRSGSITPSIVAHFLVNVLLMLYAFS